jgi:hypothetical protein
MIDKNGGLNRILMINLAIRFRKQTIYQPQTHQFGRLKSIEGFVFPLEMVFVGFRMLFDNSLQALLRILTAAYTHDV